MNKEKLFLGMESSNLWKFLSKCCRCGLSVEPLSRIACGCCGKDMTDETVTQVKP